MNFEEEFNNEFKPCPFNKSLLVSKYGRVSTLDGKILPQTIFKGYLIVTDPSGRYPLESVHRLVALTWLTDNYKKGYVVHHIDGNGFNNRVDNLVWEENLQHAITHGWEDVDEFGTWIKGL